MRIFLVLGAIPLGISLDARVYSLNSNDRCSDFPFMQEAPLWKRMIVCDAPVDALGPKTDLILSRLGYRMVLPETFEQLRREDPGVRADVMLVDERRLSEFLDLSSRADDPSVPVVVLTGKHGIVEGDPRIVGGVKRPAGLHDLYRLLQQIFEDKPRSTPRVATQLRVRCEQGDRNWDGRVLSLSENGCLMRSSEAIALGRSLRIEFSLPETGSIRLNAEATYQLLPDVGLVFSGVAPGHREMLERFVTESILSA